LARHQLHRGAGTACDLRALARLHLDAMHRGTHRNVAQRQGVAGLDRRILAGHHAITGLHALGRDDVATFTVGVAQQRDVSRAVRVVLETFAARRNAFLVTLGVDDAVMLLVPTATMTRGDAAMMVATTGLGLR